MKVDLYLKITILLNYKTNTSVNDSNESKDTEELDRTKLCNTLGISPEENVTFNTDINKIFKIISKINYDDDLEKCLIIILI